MTFEEFWAGKNTFAYGNLLSKGSLNLDHFEYVVKQAYETGYRAGLLEGQKELHKPKLPESYEDMANCPHCHKETRHLFRDSGHERDSSGDYQKCLECHWWAYGMSPNEYRPPIK